MKKYITLLFLSIIYIILMSACSHHSDLESFNQYYYGGDNKKAYDYAKSKVGNGDVLWNLQAGVSAFHIGEEDGIMLLTQGEILFGKYEQEGLLGGIFGNIGAMLTNDNIKTYRGNIYEGVMFNYYKALYAMSQKDYTNARVEFNRANDRQRRAKDYFHKDIQKALEQQDKQNAKNSTLSAVSDNSKSSIYSTLEKEYSNLKYFKAYNGFINPAISYISALFFMSEEDYSKAIDLYKESYAINHAEVINQDLKILQSRKNKQSKERYTWIIIEDGRSAYKYDKSLNLLPFYFNDKILHIGVSIPILVNGKTYAKSYQAQSIKGEIFKSFEVADMDSVIINEFQKQLPFIFTRAITSAILKAITQAMLADQLGDIGAIIGMLYSTETTSADIRISTALPKRILAMQIPNEAEDFILKAEDTPLYHVHFKCTDEYFLQTKKVKIQDTIILCQKYDNIIYFRIKGQNPTYRILKGGIDE